MPRAKSTKYYPTEFFDLADKIGRMLVPELKLQFPTEREAKSVQGRFYAFLGALKREVAEGPLNKTAEAEADWRFKNELLPFAHKVYIVTNGKGEAVFRHRSESWYAKAISQALAGVVPAQSVGGPAVHDYKENAPNPAPVLNESPDVLASLERLRKLGISKAASPPTEPVPEPNQAPISKE